jgi:hypothetical protein
MSSQGKTMSHSDPDNRKDVRRNSIKKKKSFDKKDYNLEYRDQNKLKKQFKKHKQDVFEEEIWDEWQNDLP